MCEDRGAVGEGREIEGVPRREEELPGNLRSIGPEARKMVEAVVNLTVQGTHIEERAHRLIPGVACQTKARCSR